MIELAIFILTSAFLAFISRKSFSYPRSHGFARFFAWEAILILFLINAAYWFDDRFSPLRVMSTILLFVSIYLVVHGVILLKIVGRPNEGRPDPALFSFEKTSTLVRVGIYKYIRHPMCSSLLFLTWGIFLKNVSWIGFFLALLASLFLFITAKIDESECLDYFGSAYQGYIRDTKRFIPFLL